jgi:hypothetical protein
MGILTRSTTVTVLHKSVVAPKADNGKENAAPTMVSGNRLSILQYQPAAYFLSFIWQVTRTTHGDRLLLSFSELTVTGLKEAGNGKAKTAPVVLRRVFSIYVGVSTSCDLRLPPLTMKPATRMTQPPPSQSPPSQPPRSL